MHRLADKKELRASFLERRRQMTFEEVYALSSAAQRNMLTLDCFKTAKRLSLYASFQNEVLTNDLFQMAVEAGKEVFYPRVKDGNKRRLGFFRVKRLDELSQGSYEIPEPQGEEPLAHPSILDLIVVPGVAFDVKGARLGFGKGYYDMALAGFGSSIVALAYDFQVVKGELPVEPTDVPVSTIVTERRTIDCSGR
ncbi:MAG: 5-formyltetrahydrofolate cyclo-ligase [Deltaproteobacteria bacterium]|nr:5-formyltetrahydrofolate cyclo-ligase [Deltaproteobacteria bacterium]